MAEPARTSEVLGSLAKCLTKPAFAVKMCVLGMGAVRCLFFSLLTRVVATSWEKRRKARGGKPRQGRVVGDTAVPSGRPYAKGWRGNFLATLRGRSPNIVGQLMTPRSWLLVIMHAAVFGVGYWLAYLLRFDFAVPPSFVGIFWLTLGWVIGLKLLIFCLLGQFRGWWRYVTFADLTALFRASALSFLVLATVNFFGRAGSIPKSVIILDCIMTVAMLGMVRASWRMFREVCRPMFDAKRCPLGAAGWNGSLQRNSRPSDPIQLSSALSDPRLAGHGRRRNGARLGQIPILGKLEDVCEIAASRVRRDVLVVAGTLPGRGSAQPDGGLRRGKLNLKIIRSVEDRLEGDNHVPIRDIEINDLLGRDPVTLDTENIGKLLEGRRVMVTGAGGSIGSEICRQIVTFHPAIA